MAKIFLGNIKGAKGDNGKNFALWLNKPVYAIYRTAAGYIKNVKTGENMGKETVLRINLHDENFLPLKTERYEENCYVFAKEEAE